MDHTRIVYAADGVDFLGALFMPAGTGPVPGVLVAHESPGLSEHTLGMARRFAELGFAALATDYQGGGQFLTDRAEMMRRYQRFMADPSHIRARMSAALDALKAQPRIDAARLAAAGYCYGGTAALELARGGADLKLVAGFHCGLASARPAEAAGIKARIIVHIGAEDPIVPAAERQAFEQEMIASGADWRLTLHGRTGHSFTNPEADRWGMPGFAYQAESDRLAWEATKAAARDSGLI